MCDIAELLKEIKLYLSITWDDEDTDRKITGYINRGMARLNDIAGVELDFESEGLPRQLLFDYCRYANAQSLEAYIGNFQADFLQLKVSNMEDGNV